MEADSFRLLNGVKAMMDSGEEYSVSGSVTNRCYIACINGELSSAQMGQLYDEIVRMAEKRELRGVIMDLNGLAVLDSAAFCVLRKISGALALMGLKSAWMGIKPAIASSLVDFGADVDDLCICQNIEDGVRLMGFQK